MTQTPLLSVLMPALNEGKTIDEVVRAVLDVDLSLEVLLLDDGSTDDTWSRMQYWADGDRVRAFRHTVNQGKGAALRTVMQRARGQYVLIQDCDLEYNPQDYHKLLEPLARGRATVVYGTRVFSSHSAYSYWYVLGNRFVTNVANLLYNVYLSDMNTCYKVFPRDVGLALDLQASGFDVDPEITAKLLRLGHRIYEVPIEYAARSRAEGKKVRARDGLKSVEVLGRCRLWKPKSVPHR